MAIEVVYAEEFFRAARKLQRRYPHILDDAESLADRLEVDEKPGDRLRGLEYKAYKVRVKNRDAQRGKSGGYRIIYYFESASKVVLITIYRKSDQSDIPTDVIRRIIEEYETQKP
jgi:mRNA-degrading endonuclease RelE of RelBE toxin-antitoxin system